VAVKRLIFAAFVAFLASTATIGILARLAPERQPAPPEKFLSAAEIARHDSQSDCWIIIDDAVYIVTKYIPLHPTPPDVITRWCGKDATEGFATKGTGSAHSPAARAMLKKYSIGKIR
jgi:cytochrome b involved in lipid metabolism